MKYVLKPYRNGTKEEEKKIKSKKETKEEKDFLHDACISVIKATEVHINSSFRHWTDEKRNPDILEYVYPAIVFDGRMYWATYDDGNTILEEIDYIQLKWETKNAYHTIDVVKSEHFEKYLSMINDELEELAKGAESIKGLFQIVKGRLRSLLEPSDSSNDEDSKVSKLGDIHESSSK